MQAKPPRYAYVQWEGVDDYLHQAASSEWWPDDIIYDPDQTGKPISSMGVHEHWNNEDEMLYSRNLNTGNGIELVKIFADSGQVQDIPTILANKLIVKVDPMINHIDFEFTVNSPVTSTVRIFNLQAELMTIKSETDAFAGERQLSVNIESLTSGVYIYQLQLNGNDEFGLSAGKFVIER